MLLRDLDRSAVLRKSPTHLGEADLSCSAAAHLLIPCHSRYFEDLIGIEHTGAFFNQPHNPNLNLVFQALAVNSVDYFPLFGKQGRVEQCVFHAIYQSLLLQNRCRC